MKFFFVSLLISIETSTDSEIKTTENNVLVYNDSLIQNLNDLSKNNSFCATDNNLIYFNTSEYNQYEMKVIEDEKNNSDESSDDEIHEEENIDYMNEFNEKFEDIMEFLEQTSYEEPTKEELDMCKPVKMNYKKLRKILKHEKRSKFNQKNSKKNTIEYFKKKITAKIPCYNVQDIEIIVNINNLYGFQDYSKSRNDQTLGKNDFLKHSEVKCKPIKFTTYILNYISQNIKSSYKNNLIKRLEDLKITNSIFDKHQQDENNIFDLCDDERFVKELRNIYLTFDKNSLFDKKTCEKYDKKFNSSFFKNREVLDILHKLDPPNEQQKKVLFFFKLMKLYKYIIDIPEILTLGRAFSDASFYKVFFTLHLIDLFGNKIGDLKDSRVFILCMIHKALKCCFEGKKFELFKVPKYEFMCTNKCKHDLYFFLWELNSNKRNEIKNRKNSTSEHIKNDKKYFNVVFLLFLYQHSIFMKYLNVSAEYYDSFISFIKKIVHSKDFNACQFNEYLKRTQNFNKEFF